MTIKLKDLMEENEIILSKDQDGDDIYYINIGNDYVMSMTKPSKWTNNIAILHFYPKNQPNTVDTITNTYRKGLRHELIAAANKLIQFAKENGWDYSLGNNESRRARIYNKLKSLKRLMEDSNQNIEYWFHGRTVDSTNFSLDYVGGEGAYDQEGPGFYFTSDFENAKRYAEYKGIVLKCKINYKKLIYKTESKITSVNKKIVVDLINKSPNRDDILYNFDENLNQAFVAAVNTYTMYEHAWDSYQTLANDFYKHDAKKYLIILSKYYDGQITDRVDGIKHLIVYNPKIIKIVEKIQL